MLHEIQFDCWRFDFGPRDLGFDSQIFAIWFEVARFGNQIPPWITNVYAAHVLVGPFPCHKHNNDMASAWERFVCNQRVEVPTWVTTRRTWRSHLQVTHQRHFGGQPCRTTIQPCDSWPRSTWAFRQLLPASNSVAGAIVRACHNRLSASTVESVLLSMQQWFYKST